MRTKENTLNVYLSYTHDYPDAESNNGVFNTGKIKVTPPNEDGIFSLEW
jgi:hypothetical protein